MHLDKRERQFSWQRG